VALNRIAERLRAAKRPSVSTTPSEFGGHLLSKPVQWSDEFRKGHLKQGHRGQLTERKSIPSKP